MSFSFARQAFLKSGITFGVAACASAGALAADGKAIYDKTCVACHAAGVANAPKLGDKAAWAPRVASGKDALLSSVIKGKGAMPPKAGAADLKDDEIKAAIDFMLAAVK
jgi:cytochrome c5